MKFRTIFFLFNLIILLSFAFIFLMPLPVLGWSYAVTFWSQNWPIALLFVGILAALDAYFLFNWRLYTLLEREDWNGLKEFLDAELARKGVLSLQKSRIYINACLIGQSPGKISELRDRYLQKKVAYLPRLALSLGLPLVLEGQVEQTEEFFGPLAHDKSTGADGPWIRWSLAFVGLLGQKKDEARAALEGLVNDKKQPLLELLSLYLLDTLRGGAPAVEALLAARVPILKGRLTEKEWTSHIDRLKENVILILFMGKLIQEARDWLKNSTSGGKA